MRKIASVLVLMALAVGATAQQPADPVVVEVAGRKIRQQEFMKEFRAAVGDNLSKKPSVTEAEKRQALIEYVNLYANFQAKVADARSMGMDTARGLERELRQYRTELAAPYLIDSTAMTRLLAEAYDRNRFAMRAAHILVKVSEDASPEDTLEAWQHAEWLRGRIVGGEPFARVAAYENARQAHADTLNLQVKGHEGDLGYFTAFDMVYPFESGVYGLQVGEVSHPVRTRYGYHIIKLLDKVELYGNTTLAHIWLRSPDSVTNSRAIQSIYDQLVAGAKFDYLARSSDDRTTAEKGGLMDPLAINQMLPEYVHEAGQLREGEFSKPFRTRYGWHIIQVVKRDQLPPLENMTSYYKQKMSRDQRGDASRKSFAQASRKRFNIIDYTKVPEQPKDKKSRRQRGKKVPMMASLDQLVDIMTDSVMRGRWYYADTMITDLRPIAKTPDDEYNLRDLALFIYHHQRKDYYMAKAHYVRLRYEEFLDSLAVACADRRLEADNPDFAAIVDEYRRGLMIFNYNERMIWTKAIEDSAGFADFYARESRKKRMDVPEDSVFFWRVRARVLTATIADSVCMSPAKAKRLMEKALAKNQGSADVSEALKKGLTKQCKADKPVSVAVDLVERGNQKLLDDDCWQRGVYVRPNRKGYRVLMVQDVLQPSLKSQSEARGYYLNEYQNELERELNNSLRQKYGVKIHWDVVDKITY